MTRPSTRPRPVGAEVRRRSAVYGITTVVVDRATGEPMPGQVEVGYIGKSVQTVKEREDQHRACQPFGDLIVGGSWTIEEGYWTAAQLDAKERHYIRAGAVLVPGQAPQRPVYNYDHNTDNPGRIKVWRAEQHRQAREPGWVRPAKGSSWVPRQRSAAPPPVAATSRPGWLRRQWWTRPRRIAAAWSALWLLLAGVVGWFGASGEVATGWDGAWVGAGVASTTVGRLMPPWRRRVRRRRRR